MMAKKKSGKRDKLPVQSVGKRKTFVLIGLLLTLILAGAAFAAWGSLFAVQKQRTSSKTATSPTTPTTQSLAPASPSKEYIYAGGRLVATEEPVAATASYNGYLDGTDCNSIYGWAWDANQPNTPINVDLYDSNTFIATVAANQFRQDLVNAGIGNGYHGFSVTTPPSLKDGQTHTIYAKYGGTGTNLNATPKTVTCVASQTNLALNKPATQSSTPVLSACGTTAPASLAVDGNTNGSLANCSSYSVSHTNFDANAWWQVDLGVVQSIQTIQVYNRTDCCQTRLSNYYVFVSDAAFASTDLNTTLNQAGVSSYFQAAQAGSPTTVTVNRTGRYVRVQLLGTDYLHMAEVQVWGTAATRSGSISASPNPIQVCDGSGLGVTTLTWSSAGTTAVEVHVNSPAGDLFAASGTGGNYSSTTGKWVGNGTTFYLQDVSGGLSLTSTNTLATVVASTTTVGCSTRGTFNGPHNIPGTLQVEDFDTGGEGVAYHDLTSGNDWGQYRPSEAVDIVGTADTGGGYEVGNAVAGEWLEYTVSVQTAQSYDIQARVASLGQGGTFRYLVDGISKGSVSVPNTGSWSAYQTITLANVSLGIGSHVLRVALDTNGASGAVANFNYFNFVASAGCTAPSAPTGLTATAGNAQATLNWNAVSGATGYNVKRSLTVNGTYTTVASNLTATTYTNTGLTNGTTYYYVISALASSCESANSSQVSATPSARSPFNQSGTPWPVPGQIEVENYDNGGEGVAYHDLEATNIGGAYRSDGVDLAACVEGGYEVGWAYAGEWLEYTVNLAVGGTYTIQARVASDGQGGTFHISFNGNNVTGAMTVPNTGGWASYQMILVSNVSLSAGTQVMRIAMDANGSQPSPAIGNFNWINIVGGSTPSAPTGLSATAGNAQVTLNWNGVSGATSYKVKRSTTSGGPYTVINGSVTATSYTDTGLTNGTTYYYVVSAVNASGEGPNSAQASATPTAGPTPPTAPMGLTATAGNQQVALIWNAVSGATSYTVKRSTTSGSGYTNVISGLTGTSYTNTGLTSGTTYYFVVSASNSAGEGPNSSPASATPTGGSGGTCTTISTFSGNGVVGYLEGAGTAAQWNSPYGGAVAKDPVSGYNAVFVADTGNHRIRMIYLEGPNAGVSILIAGSGIAGYYEGGGDPFQAYYSSPHSVSVVTDANGVATELLIADTDNNLIRKLLRPTSGSAWQPIWFSGSGTVGLLNGTADVSQYYSPRAAVKATDGYVYVTDANNNRIRKLDSAGASATLVSGYSAPSGITVSPISGLLYFTEMNGHNVYKLTTAGNATKIAGATVAGFADGTGIGAKFNNPYFLVWANTAGGEVLYIADRKNYRIRKLVIATNAVTTFAGTGTAGYLDGGCSSAQFNVPRGVALGPSGEVYIMDAGNNRIRKTQ
jgi:fibronectin type 3 domain-containing protein